MAVIVVGAGVAGLACARALTGAGVPVRVVERGHVPGGRLASRRFAGRPADIGAAYFTVSDPAFAEVVDGWRRAGLARPWTDTFQVYDRQGRRASTGPMRWAAPGGLRSLAEHLADRVPVGTRHTVGRVGPGPRVDGEPADAVVLAMPGPQAARVLHPDLRAAAGAAAGQQWSPVLASVLHYPQRTWDDFAGAFVNDHPVLATVCDDGDRRGDRAPVLVAHSTTAFARAHLDEPGGAADEVERAVRRLLDLPDPAAGIHVHRWTFARPQPSPATATFHLDDDRIALAGDAFGEPRVQTAWRSGHDAGRALAALLTD
jgi:hypothetical protein